jgi:NADH-quinone oxidoreductase subunit L
MRSTFPLFWIPLLPLAGAAVNLLVGRKLSRAFVHAVGCGTVLGSLLTALVAVFSRLYPLYRTSLGAGHGEGGGVIPALTSSLFDWISAGPVSIKMGFLLDPLSAVMVLVITFVGFLIHVYSTGYMAHDHDAARFFGYLNLFTGAMLMLVLGDSLVVLFVGWEGVGLCSYLLIGFWYDKDGTSKPGDANATAGKKAFIVNRIGDYAFVLGMLLLFGAVGTLNIEELAQRGDALLANLGAIRLPSITVASAAAVLLLIGATGKSAQIPLYVWLPDAMAGPTPVSALIHAATMVTAGVYMVARLNFVFMLSPFAMGLVALVGAVTALFAATIGFAQNDIKKVLAYSTISQLGYMFVGVGVGAFSAGIFHLFTHAFFKACLFLGAGSVIHAMSGKQDIREMGGLMKRLPLTAWTFLVATVAIAGVPPLAGFFSKDEILWRALSTANPAWPIWFAPVVYVLALAAALCTAFYMFRLFFLTFTGECRADEATRHHIHESPPSMTMPLVVLAAGAAVLGLLGIPGERVNLFHRWLAPVVDRGAALAASLGRESLVVGPSHLSERHAVEYGLMGLSVLIALAGIYLASRLYRGGFSEAIKGLAARIPRLHRAVAAKYKIDELYHWIIVHPFRWGAFMLWKGLDAFLIDFVGVNGTAWLVDRTGRIARRLQNGNLQQYIVLFVAGLAAIVFLATAPPQRLVMDPARVARVGETVALSAEVPGSTEGRRLLYAWDFDGDGKWDAQGPEPRTTHVFERPGRYQVVVKILDPRFNSTTTRSQTLEVK